MLPHDSKLKDFWEKTRNLTWDKKGVFQEFRTIIESLEEGLEE